MTLSEYEQQRLRNIEHNKEILQSLGLNQPFFPVSVKKSPIKSIGKSRLSFGPKDTSKAATESTLRRSQRNINKNERLKDIEEQKPTKNHVKDTWGSSSAIHLRESSTEPRSVSKRTQNPKMFGPIPGVPVGSWWQTREECSLDAVHAPWVGGISCSPYGAYSVALSGGYDDDVDFGYTFTYTGSGGRDLKGTKQNPKNLRTAPQSSDQTFENRFNKALQMSAKTKRPIRVIRGFKLNSPYAPAEGYRYDGLYTVEKAWQQQGLATKFLVCKFAFKRLSGQPPLPVQMNKEKLSDDDKFSEETNLI